MDEYSIIDSDLVLKSETSLLIASSKVEGTAVYNSRGNSLGSIYDVMIDKRSGKVSYAVMSFGGFFGIGQHYHALPWESLQYDWHEGGYVVNAETEGLLSRAMHDFAPQVWRAEFSHKVGDDFRITRHGRDQH
jgi:sporulation protein YlmC with PRC-barrel domain